MSTIAGPIPSGQLAFLDHLADEIPAVSRLRDDHLDFHGELLPHLLMADVARYVASFFGHDSGSVPVAPPSEEELRRTLAVLDAGMATPDEYVQELISVSFLENIEHEPYTSDLMPLLGANLQRELKRRASS